MTHSLQSILRDRVPSEPPEIAVIKQFIREEFSADCNITVQPENIIIQVRSSALAGAIRPHLHALKEACRTEKRLMLRIV